MRYIVFLCFFFISTSRLLAFEGDIQLTRQSQYDTTYLVFYFKDDKVRIDEFSETGQLSKSMIMDLKTERIIALSPTLKLYTDITRKIAKSHSSSQFEINKTTNYKYIQGNKCFQWRVRNKLQENEITYWVMESDNDIMEKLFYILNATENYSSIPSYYQYIPQTSGYIPMVAVERNLVREERESIHVTAIKEKKLPANLFEIPKDYKNLKS